MLNQDEILIPVDDVEIGATLHRPDDAVGVVIFAHGSGSSRHSPRNRFVARSLSEAGLATVLLDLLTSEEASQREPVFDIARLSERLIAATEWISKHEEFSNLPIGFFGASTGAAAALQAAARMPTRIRAVVSRGGRPDLAGEDLGRVRAPTRLIVGGHDDQVIRLNQAAFRLLPASKDLSIVPRATHLFEEPGALEEVADLAREWFLLHLPRPLRFLEAEAGGDIAPL